MMNENEYQEEIPETDGGDEEESNQLELDERQAHAFEETFDYLEKNVSQAEQETLQLSVTQIMVEAARGENANETLLWKRLDDLRRTHPHVLQKLLDGLNATGTGFHTRVRRVTERMAEEINNPSPDQEVF
jgi:DNA invertase Pin-like site-specific DNA recombinase